MRPATALAIACGVYAVVLTLLGADRYVTYHSGADLGEFVQAIASPLQGLRDVPEGGSHFLHHFSPILYLCAPVLLLAHSPIALIALQAIAGALVAPPLYLLVVKRAGERLALVVALVALVYPALVGVTFTDFHENGFAPATVAWLAWAIDARRWRRAAGFVALLLAIKEDEALLLIVLGAGFAIWAYRRGDRTLARFAVATALAGALTLVLYFAVVRPLAGARNPWFGFMYAGAAMPHPQGWGELFGRVSFLLEAFVPLCFVPLLRRHVLYVVPGLAEVLASRWSIAYTMGQHYAGVCTGEMLVAYALTLAGFAAQGRAAVAQRLAVASLALCLLNLTLASPTHWRHYLRSRTAHDAVLDRAVAAIPPGASVGTFDEVYAHLGFNPAARFGVVDLPEFVILDRRYPSAEWRDTIAPRVRALARRGIYRLEREEDGVELYRRG